VTSIGTLGAVAQFFKKLTTSDDANKHLLFVYGTLREGYHWNSKFLSSCRKVCDAKTDEKYPLVVGKSCVPYLLGDLPDAGHQIIGEVWEVDSVSLQNLDEYPIQFHFSFLGLVSRSPFTFCF
jgi:gamma-glutamylcyclotransferase (GGCT)/AIG2-like uncharacterized protein YtfP